MGYATAFSLIIDNSYRQSKLDEKMLEKEVQIQKIQESNLGDETKAIVINALKDQYDSYYKEVTKEDVLDVLLDIEYFVYGDPFEGEYIKWENHENNMKTVSKKFKDVLFILSGEGEEAGDLWKEYYMNGKVQVAEAKIEFDSFDPSKLQ